MAVPPGCTQVPFGPWVKSDGSGPYSVDVGVDTTGDAIPLPSGFWVKRDGSGPFIRTPGGTLIPYLAAAGGGGGGGGGVIAPSIAVRRTSGPAPLAITYDATGTTRSGWTPDQVFRDCNFLFEVVGQTGVSTYATTGLDRYSQSGGPVCAFNLLNPGTYTVKVTVTDGLGNSANASVTITVTDPNTVFAGTSTQAVSTSGTFNGATAVPGLVTGPSITVQSNTRYLLRGGETFSSITIPMGVTNVYFGSFGSGNAIVPAITAAESSHVFNWPNTVVIRDLNIQNIDFNTTSYRWTIYNNTMTGGTAANGEITNGGALDYHIQHDGQPLSTYYHPHEIHIFENTIDGAPVNPFAPQNNINGLYHCSSIVANVANNSYEHTVRVYSGSTLFIGHNSFGGVDTRDSIRVTLKMHARGNHLAYSDDMSITGAAWPGSGSPSLAAVGGMATVNVVLANNLLGSASATGSWNLTPGPQNTDGPCQSPPYGTIEFLKNIIIENNTFFRAAGTTEDIHLLCQNGITRGNAVSGGAPLAGHAIKANEYPAIDDSCGYDYARRIMPSDCGPYYGQLT